jgi:hypothetical protein
MTIEQVFRDQKNRRNGWALRNIQVTKADRFERLLLILVFAYVLLVGLGHYCRAYMSSAHWSSNTRPMDCSAFSIGRAMVGRCEVSPLQAFAALCLALRTVQPK